MDAQELFVTVVQILSKALYASNPAEYSLLALATYFPCPYVTDAFEVVSSRYELMGAGGYAWTVRVPP